VWENYSKLFSKPSPRDLVKVFPIESMTDEATGFKDKVLDDAFQFFLKCVWTPCVMNNDK
jgi:hypothetical protein